MVAFFIIKHLERGGNQAVKGSPDYKIIFKRVKKHFTDKMRDSKKYQNILLERAVAKVEAQAGFEDIPTQNVSIFYYISANFLI